MPTGHRKASVKATKVAAPLRVVPVTVKDSTSGQGAASAMEILRRRQLTRDQLKLVEDRPPPRPRHAATPDGKPSKS